MLAGSHSRSRERLHSYDKSEQLGTFSVMSTRRSSGKAGGI